MLSQYRIFIFLLLGISCLTFSGCKFTDTTGNGSPYSYVKYIGELDTPGHAYAIDISAPNAYVADGAGGLRIIDITNTAFPHEIDRFETEGTVYDVKHYGRYAYLACGEEGFKIVDVESPFGAELLGEYQTTNAFAIDHTGNYIYLADYIGGLKILDISNVYVIDEVSRLNLSGQAVYSVNVEWPYLYVGSRYGFSIVNIENPYNPYEVYYEALDYVYDIDVHNQYAYMAFYGGLQIYDISNIQDVKIIGEKILPSPARSVVVRGDYAYLSLGSSGLTIVRIANPAQPYEVEWYRPYYSEINDITLSGRYLYTANGNQGMLILEFWPGF